MKTFTEAEWVAVHPDYKRYIEGVPFFYTYEKGIGTVWVPVWFSDLQGTQDFKDAVLAEVVAVHGKVELWLRSFTGSEGNVKNVQHIGFQVRDFGHPALSGPCEKDVKAPLEGGVLATTQGESVIFPASRTGLKDAIVRMKREIERRGGPHAGAVGPRKKRMRPIEEADESLVTELVLYIENDSELYRQQTQPWILNLARKRYKGRYDEKPAVKALLYLVDAGFKKYRKEFATPDFKAGRATKEAAARELLEYYQEEINQKVRELAEKTRTPKAKPVKGPKPVSVKNPDKAMPEIPPPSQAQDLAKLKAKDREMKESSRGLLESMDLGHLVKNPAEYREHEKRLAAEIQKGVFPINAKTSDGKLVKILYATPWAGKPGEVSRVLVLYWPGKEEYSTHEERARGGYYSGHYFTSLSSALGDFEERIGIRPPEPVFRTKGLPG
jgi:hypothetical protein